MAHTPGRALAPERSVHPNPTQQSALARLLAMVWARLKDFAGLKGDASYLWPRWLILRGVGLVYLFVFAGLLREGQALIGPHGLAPLADFFTRLKAEVPNPFEAFLRAPGLFWLDSGGGMINAVAWLGLFAAMALVLNLWPRMALFICWVAFLSFVTTLRVFSQTQVDQLMLETAILCIPFAPAGFHPRLGANFSPRPITLLMLRLFLLRIMLEAGLMKLFVGDQHWRNFTAMDVLYETTPFPTFLGYLDFQLPHLWHAGEAILTFVAEVAAPVVAVFGARRARWFAFISWVILQAGIQLTNNFGWLNTTSIALGLILLDDQMLAGLAGKLRLRTLAARLAGEPQPVSVPVIGPWKRYGLRVFLWGQFYFSLHVFAVNFCGLSPDDFLHRRLRAALMWFQSANSYSLYAALVPKRTVVEFEGSNDGGRTWRPYDFRYQAQREDQIPGFIAPYYARFEATLQAETLNDTPSTIYDVVAARLLQREPSVMALFRSDPFPDRPPGLLRLPVSQLKFTDFPTYRKTGHFWRKETIGVYQPAVYITAAGQVARVVSPVDELGVMAMQGNPQAQEGLGEFYAAGAEGLAKNPPEAFKWFQLAAAQGEAEAQFRLGYMLAYGEGIARNSSEAMTWLLKAAEQGHDRAQFLLGLVYANGSGVPKNAAEAVRWYQASAEQGNIYAQINLSFHYATGEGVAKDEREALVWLNLAALAGSADAQKNLAALERKAAPEDVIAARQRAAVRRAQMEKTEKAK